MRDSPSVFFELGTKRLSSVPIDATCNGRYIHFCNYGEVENWVVEWIDSEDRLFFCRGIQLLPEKWEKVIPFEV